MLDLLIQRHGGTDHFALRRKQMLIACYPTVQDAKRASWDTYGVVPPMTYGDSEADFDADVPLHSAIRRLQNRSNTYTEVVAVGKTSYLIRRSKWGIDIPINYHVAERLGQPCVVTRGDYEVI